MCSHAVGGAGLAPRAAGRSDARAAGERRGLSVDGTARSVELLFQFLVFAAETLSLRFRTPQVLAQALVVTPQALQLRGIDRRWVRTLRHAPVMPDSRAQYKREMRVSRH